MANYEDEKSLYKNRKTRITPTTNGIGYYIPSNVSKEEWKRLKTHWEKKLSNAGFIDIERAAADHSGFFSPYLYQNSIEKNRNVHNDGIMAAYEGYYDYCSSFYQLFNFRDLNKTTQFKRKYGLARELMRLHAAGVSYIDMTKAIIGQQSRYMKRFGIKPVQPRYREKRSKYWCFTFMMRILEQMWLWHATTEEGSLTPYDLKFMEGNGVTAELYEKAKALLLLKPCKRLSDVMEAREAAEAL